MADNQPRKYAGKYDSVEAMEQGFANMVSEFDRIKSEAREKEQRLLQAETQVRVANEFMAQMNQRQPAPEPALRAEDGVLDDRAIQQYIDAKMTSLGKKLDEIPNLVDSRLAAVLAPFNAAQSAKSRYIGSNPDFDDSSIQRFLGTNPGVNRTFQKLLANPESAEDAYKYAHDMFRASAPKTSAVDESKKRDAGAPQPGSGPSLSSSEGGPSQDDIRNAGRKAQTTFAPEDELAAARAWFKGSKVLQNIDSMKPDWAKE